MSDTNFPKAAFTVTMDGVSRTIDSIVVDADGEGMSLLMASDLPAHARVVVTYDESADLNPPTDVDGNQLGSFTRVVTVTVVTADIYDALAAYFSGTAARGQIDAVIGAGNQAYHQKLREEVAAGRLNQIVPAGRTQWGTEGTVDWGQVGFTSTRRTTRTRSSEGNPSGTRTGQSEASPPTGPTGIPSPCRGRANARRGVGPDPEARWQTEPRGRGLGLRSPRRAA